MAARMTIGFFVKLIFIPINNIIVGSGWFDFRRCFFRFSRLFLIWSLYDFNWNLCVSFLQFDGYLDRTLCLDWFHHLGLGDLILHRFSKACVYAFRAILGHDVGPLCRRVAAPMPLVCL
jgi:hypothetical protein